MLNLLIFAFKFLFLFLIYLFLFLLIRMVYKDMASLKKSSGAGAEVKFETFRPRLVVLKTPHGEVGQTYELKDNSVIGRSSQNDVALDDSFASSSHARIRKKNNQFILEDLGSTNGTYLEGEKLLEPSPLKTGSKIRVGRTLLEFLH